MKLILRSSLLSIYHIFSITAIIWDMPSDGDVSTWSSSHHQRLLQEWRHDLHCSCSTLLRPGPHRSSCTLLHWQSQGCGAQMPHWWHCTGSVQENPLNSRTHYSKLWLKYNLHIVITISEILHCLVDYNDVNCLWIIIILCANTAHAYNFIYI